MYIPVTTHSQIAKIISDINEKEDEEETSTLVKLLRQTSCCEICHKCISEKKKLIAHRKICLRKYQEKNKLNEKNQNSTNNINLEPIVDSNNNHTESCLVIYNSSNYQRDCSIR
jgi:hypothetical protein